MTFSAMYESHLYTLNMYDITLSTILHLHRYIIDSSTSEQQNEFALDKPSFMVVFC